MSRDIGLIRELLPYIETKLPQRIGWINVAIPSRTNKEINYHLKLLVSESLI